MNKRTSGVLLHISSLPSSYGIGDLGPAAYRFVDFLADARQGVWQILPISPTSDALGNSPYSSFSAYAGNPLFISPDLLAADGLITVSEAEESPRSDPGRVDYPACEAYKNRLLRNAYERYSRQVGQDYEFERFCHEQQGWLDDYAAFVVIKEEFGGREWAKWPLELRDRHDHAMREFTERRRDRIVMEKFFQYLFFRQWEALRTYSRGKNIRIIGDLPIYVSHDSCDVWSNPHVFKLNGERWPELVSGVPPDYFSQTGQLWGTPVYNWWRLREEGYSWWIRRLEHNFRLFDAVRLDHFRGFVAYWEVPSHEKTAINGKWVEAPVRDFLDTMLRHFQSLPIIAEDLGVITPDVREVMTTYDLPGMKLLIFAFGEDMPSNPYVPHNVTRNCVVYTGTHDNNTIRGWFRKESGERDRDRVSRYLGHLVSEEDVHREFVRMAMMSVANTSIVPLQDLLGLDETGRMNTPSVARGNWEWRLSEGLINPRLVNWLAEISELYGRG